MSRPWRCLVVLLQLISLGLALDEVVTIGKTRFRQTTLLEIATYKHIAVDSAGYVFFIDRTSNYLRVYSPVDSSLRTFEDFAVYDIVNNNGTIWITSEKGFYVYEGGKLRRVNLHAEEDNFKWLHYAEGTQGSGRLYLTNDQYALFEYNIHNSVIFRQRPEVPAALDVACNRRGDLYYTNPSSNALEFKRSAALEGPATVLQGDLTISQIWQMEVDRKSDYLYICTDIGLFYVAPGETLIRKVPGFSAQLTGIGFDAHGNMYLGTRTSILKLVRIDDEPTVEELLAELEKKMEQKYNKLNKTCEDTRKHLESKYTMLENRFDALEYETNRTLTEMETRLEDLDHSYNCSCAAVTINGNVKLIGIEHNSYN